MKRYPGYITIDRGIFDHAALRKPERLVAWQWLIAMAAWKPEGRRGSWGVVHVERGELATSVRILAKTWQWPVGRVQRFLNRLRRAQMITITPTRTPSRTDSAPDTAVGPHLEHMISIVSICNYDKFQNASTGGRIKSIQQPIQQPIQPPAQTPMLPGFSPPLTTEPLNQQLDRKGELVGEKAAPAAPRQAGRYQHGTRSRHGNIYIHRGTPEWEVYAKDFRDTAGAEPFPDGGGGKWFYANGEATRPAHQRTWRNPNAFGAAVRQRRGGAA